MLYIKSVFRDNESALSNKVIIEYTQMTFKIKFAIKTTCSTFYKMNFRFFIAII